MAYFEIGIFHPKTKENIGTLWRSAYQLGAAGIFTIGKRQVLVGGQGDGIVLMDPNLG